MLVNSEISTIALNFNELWHAIKAVYKREELPWYEAMEVGQTVFCKSETDLVYSATKTNEGIYTVPVIRNTLKWEYLTTPNAAFMTP